MERTTSEQVGPEIALPTKWGELRIVSRNNCLLIFRRPWEDIPFLRLHSACMFAESLGSLDCDCGLQLNCSLKYIAKFGGAIVYLAQEGRGIGLSGKIAAIALQQGEGIDTATAYLRLGHAPDPRNYEHVVSLLKSVDFPSHLKLATNNPSKIQAVSDMGYVVDRFKLEFEVSPAVLSYLDEKRAHLGHYD